MQPKWRGEGKAFDGPDNTPLCGFPARLDCAAPFSHA
jgi:hypothetical protein